jgi:hypothetical protein
LRNQVTAAPSFALQMVQACVLYLDEQRSTPVVRDFAVKYTKSVEADDGYSNSGRNRTRSDLEVGISVRFQSRDDVDATCTIFYAGDSEDKKMWKGVCALTTLTSTGPETLKFEVSENHHGLGLHAPGLVVRPFEGPLFPVNIVARQVLKALLPAKGRDRHLMVSPGAIIRGAVPKSIEYNFVNWGTARNTSISKIPLFNL